MDLRQEMMTRLGAGERLVDLCREYGISRKTGHKFKERYEAQGLHGLADQTRAPRVIPHRTSPELAELICAERRAHPTWGAHKIKAVMERRGQAMPSHGAIERVIKQAGLVIPRPRRHRYEAKRTMLRTPTAPNDVWSIDYKGQFRLGDRSRAAWPPPAPAAATPDSPTGDVRQSSKILFC